MSNDQQGPDANNDPQPPPWGATPGETAPSGQPAQPTPYGQPVQPAQPTPYGQPVQPVQPTPYGQPVQPAPYGQQPPYGPPPPATTDGLSIAALVTGILGLGLVPVVLGILGLKRTKERGTSGRGLAIAGIVLGAVELVAGAVIVAISLIALLGLSQIDENSSGSFTVQSEAPTPTSEESLDTSDTSGTALLDIAPLEVAGFTSAGLVPDDVLVQAGALESYTASYTDGTSVVAAVLTDWTTEAEAQAWAATKNAAFTADQLTDSGDDGNGITYQLYEVGDVATVVATNYTAAFTLTGPYDAVVAIYQEYPL